MLLSLTLNGNIPLTALIMNTTLGLSSLARLAADAVTQFTDWAGEDRLIWEMIIASSSRRSFSESISSRSFSFTAERERRAVSRAFHILMASLASGRASPVSEFVLSV